MSTLSVDSINGQTVASKVSIPGHIVGAAVSQITENSSRGSAQGFGSLLRRRWRDGRSLRVLHEAGQERPDPQDADPARIHLLRAREVRTVHSDLSTPDC